MMTDILSTNAKNLEKYKKTLTSTEKRYLEYFWNKKAKKIRRSIPRNVITFLESEDYHEDLYYNIYLNVQQHMLELSHKGYLKEVDIYESGSAKPYVLDEEGRVYLENKHRAWVEHLKDFINGFPPILTIIVGVIGFVSSVFGIYQFVKDVILKSVP